MEEIEEVANDCFNCKAKPCSIKGCPMQTEIPAFIMQVKEGKYKEAYDILRENNIFSHVCSLICPQENQCEGSCIRAIKAKATSIGKLERFVNEWALEHQYDPPISKKKENKKRIAIVGSGPAGLECAIELLKNGYQVDIYEKDDVPGGILIYGIPDFRLPKDLVISVIDKIRKLGATIKTNVIFGKDIMLQDLQEQYDAIFLAIGATKSLTYSLTEDAAEGIYISDKFLKAYSEKQFIKNLGTVVVIGGGNVAMDSARVAVKMGAHKVKILYRRDREHMPAREIELEEALREGVEFKELTRVISANTEKGKIVSVNCARTEIIDGKAVDVQGEDLFIEEANTIVFAIGLKPDKALLELQGIQLNDAGYIEIDENGKTNIDKVYAGGDNTESKSTVCRALAAGKKAAKGIMNQLEKEEN